MNRVALYLIVWFTLLGGVRAYAIDSIAPLKPAIDNSTAAVIAPSHADKSKWKCWSVSCGTHHPRMQKSWRKTRRFCIRTKPYVDYCGSLGQVVYSIYQFFPR